MTLKLVAASILAALLVSSLPSAAETGDEEGEPLPAPNVLTVEAATGRATFEDHGHALADIRVLGVAPETSGYDLVDPVGVVVFGNQSSTSAGVVEFWYQVLLPGTYAVHGPLDNGTTGLIVEFDAAPYAGRAPSPTATQGTAANPCIGAIKLDAVKNLLSASAAATSPCGITVPPVNSPCESTNLCTPPKLGSCPDGKTGSTINGATATCVATPKFGPCPDGKTGYTINGATATCVATPKFGPCPDGKTGYTVNGATTTCVAVPNLGPCPDGKTGYTVNRAQTACVGVPSLGQCSDGKTGYTVNGFETACINGVGPLPCSTLGGCLEYVPSAPDPETPDPEDPEVPDPDRCGNLPPSGSSRKVAEGTFWTPLVINHAPYGGKSVATSTWTNSKALYRFPEGYTSERSVEWAANIENGGQTRGVFQLAKWGMYEVTKGNYCSGHYTVRTAKVLDWKPQGFDNIREFDLWGNSATSDADDLQSISASGYGSVTFHTRYATKDAQFTSASGGSTATVSSTVYSKIGGSIGFGAGAGAVSVGMEVLELYAYKSSGSSYVYTFPAGPKCWHIDYLGAGGSGGWAFKYMGSSAC